mmetsp:Transcript_18789/g.26944  ORF Transcript_18789/g.26944 Transcript_18789/m.26944 type:complete len:89 (-) Transcript_18789:1965-2231(-)
MCCVWTTSSSARRRKNIASKAAEEVFQHCFRGCAAADGGYGSSYCFSYQEVDNPEDFFVPYIWESTLLQTPELPWRQYNLKSLYMDSS